jgi:MFS family permease
VEYHLIAITSCMDFKRRSPNQLPDLLIGIGGPSRGRYNWIIFVALLTNLSFGILFGHIMVRFEALLSGRPSFIKGVLTFNVIISAVFTALLFTSVANLVQFALGLLACFYLMKTVTRLSNEDCQPNA